MSMSLKFEPASTRHPKPEPRNLKPETRNPEPETRNETSGEEECGPAGDDGPDRYGEGLFVISICREGFSLIIIYAEERL